MKYSQKYCIVSFLEPKAVDNEFDMSAWPLHVTLADVFAIDYNSGIDFELGKLAKNTDAFEVIATQPTKLGETDVILLEKTTSLQNLHDNLINLLKSNGAAFNTPEFTHNGFLPHCTIQKAGQLLDGESARLSNLILIDMFPDSDWKRRKVLKVFELGSK